MSAPGDRWRHRRGTVAVTALAVLLGLGMSIQFRQTRDQGLEQLREPELIGILDTVNQRAARLNDEVNALTTTRDQLRTGQAGARAAVEAAQARLDSLAVLVGTVAARGPGVTVTIADPERKLTASTVLDAIQELRDAGAEAIQVGAIRVVASTAFVTSREGRILVGERPLDPPFTILAIGDPQTLTAALAIPGGVSESVRQRGAAITVTPTTELVVSALHAVSRPEYAQPVPAPTGGTLP